MNLIKFKAGKTKKLQIPMKFLGSIVFFVMISFASMAQRDLIITQAGEQIRCRILDETPTRFVYAYLGPNNKVLRNEIFKNLVQRFQYNNFPTDLVIKGKQQLPEVANKPKETGLGQQTASAATEKDQPKEATKKEKTKKSQEAKNKKNEELEDKKVETSVKPEAKEPTKVVANEPTTSKTIETASEPSASKPTETTTTATTMKTDSVAAAVTEEETTPKSKVSDKDINGLISDIHKNQDDAKASNPFAENNKNEFKNYLKYRVGIRGGISNMTEKITATDEYSLYKEKLLRGMNLGADAGYFFGEHVGFGIMYSNFQSRNKAQNITYFNAITNKETTGNIETKRFINYVGPVLYLRKNIDFKTLVVLGLSPGMYFYHDKNVYGIKNYDFKGRAPGAAATLGIDFLLGNDIIGRDIILSLEAGYNYGKINNLDYGDGNGSVVLPTPISLQRLDFSVGLRFMRFPKYLKLTSY